MARILVLLVCSLGLINLAEAFQATHVCYLESGRKVRAECIREISATPVPVPSPAPTRSPQPTVSPLDCAPIGGRKTFAVGNAQMFCFTAAQGSTFVTIEATSPGNVGCAYFALELTEPSGRRTYVDGASYPIATSSMPRIVGGRYYFWVSPLWLSDAPGCNTYDLTVR